MLGNWSVNKDSGIRLQLNTAVQFRVPMEVIILRKNLVIFYRSTISTLPLVWLVKIALAMAAAAADLSTIIIRDRLFPKPAFVNADESFIFIW